MFSSHAAISTNSGIESAAVYRQITYELVFKNLTTFSLQPNPAKSNITNMLSTTCVLWTIHRTRIDTIYRQAQWTVQSLYNLWINTTHSTLKAKYHTVLARATKELFLRKWQWLITILNCSL